MWAEYILFGCEVNNVCKLWVVMLCTYLLQIVKHVLDAR